MKNPFVLSPKVDKNLFCDREKELQSLLSIVTNGANATLISSRRMGKTVLIYRLFDEIKEKKMDIDTFYVDIYATQTTEDFITAFAEAIMNTYNKKITLPKKFLKAIGGMKPTLSFDKLTGSPELSLTFNSDNEKLNTLKSIFDFLENHDKPVIVAFDEFQQIREYKGIYMEAVLRTHIQTLRNVNFIFCGSRRHIMADMFINARMPFYCSTMNVHLDKIPIEKYTEFINRLFTENGKQILTYLQEHSDVEIWKSRDIAEGLLISSRSISGALRKLVADGFVEKVGQDPIIYSITEKGKEIKID